MRIWTTFADHILSLVHHNVRNWYLNEQIINVHTYTPAYVVRFKICIIFYSKAQLQNFGLLSLTTHSH